VSDSRALAIALSGYGQPEDRERGLDAGFDDYLVKPVSLNDLLTRIATCQAAGRPGA
jgi:DNA-binding response OmpR family regulator